MFYLLFHTLEKRLEYVLILLEDFCSFSKYNKTTGSCVAHIQLTPQDLFWSFWSKSNWRTPQSITTKSLHLSKNHKNKNKKQKLWCHIVKTMCTEGNLSFLLQKYPFINHSHTYQHTHEYIVKMGHVYLSSWFNLYLSLVGSSTHLLTLLYFFSNILHFFPRFFISTLVHLFLCLCPSTSSFLLLPSSRSLSLYTHTCFVPCPSLLLL